VEVIGGDIGCEACHVASVAVKVMNSANHDLGFCGHHFTELEADLIGQGFMVVEDLRPLLLKKDYNG
jgi:hypothetical protein